VGVRDIPGDQIQFAITQFGRRPTPQVPAALQIAIDSKRTGHFDFVIFNNDAAGFNPVDGRNVVFAGPLPAGPFRPVSFTDADYSSANVLMRVPLSAIGLKQGQTFNFRVDAFDRYFTGKLEDSVTDMSYTVGHPAFVVPTGQTFSVPAFSFGAQTPVAAGPDPGPSSQTGLLFTYRVNAGAESTALTITP
jgi:hypothetical protein